MEAFVRNLFDETDDVSILTCREIRSFYQEKFGVKLTSQGRAALKTIILDLIPSYIPVHDEDTSEAEPDAFQSSDLELQTEELQSREATVGGNCLKGKEETCKFWESNNVDKNKCNISNFNFAESESILEGSGIDLATKTCTDPEREEFQSREITSWKENVFSPNISQDLEIKCKVHFPTVEFEDSGIFEASYCSETSKDSLNEKKGESAQFSADFENIPVLGSSEKKQSADFENLSQEHVPFCHVKSKEDLKQKSCEINTISSKEQSVFPSFPTIQRIPTSSDDSEGLFLRRSDPDSATPKTNSDLQSPGNYPESSYILSSSDGSDFFEVKHIKPKFFIERKIPSRRFSADKRVNIKSAKTYNRSKNFGKSAKEKSAPKSDVKLFEDDDYSSLKLKAPESECKENLSFAKSLIADGKALKRRLLGTEIYDIHTDSSSTSDALNYFRKGPRIPYKEWRNIINRKHLEYEDILEISHGGKNHCESITIQKVGNIRDFIGMDSESDSIETKSTLKKKSRLDLKKAMNQKRKIVESSDESISDQEQEVHRKKPAKKRPKLKSGSDSESDADTEMEETENQNGVADVKLNGKNENELSGTDSDDVPLAKTLSVKTESDNSASETIDKNSSRKTVRNSDPSITSNRKKKQAKLPVIENDSDHDFNPKAKNSKPKSDISDSDESCVKKNKSSVKKNSRARGKSIGSYKEISESESDGDASAKRKESSGEENSAAKKTKQMAGFDNESDTDFFDAGENSKKSQLKNKKKVCNSENSDSKKDTKKSNVTKKTSSKNTIKENSDSDLSDVNGKKRKLTTKKRSIEKNSKVVKKEVSESENESDSDASAKRKESSSEENSAGKKTKQVEDSDNESDTEFSDAGENSKKSQLKNKKKVCNSENSDSEKDTKKSNVAKKVSSKNTIKENSDSDLSDVNGKKRKLTTKKRSIEKNSKVVKKEVSESENESDSDASAKRRESSREDNSAAKKTEVGKKQVEDSDNESDAEFSDARENSKKSQLKSKKKVCNSENSDSEKDTKKSNVTKKASSKNTNKENSDSDVSGKKKKLNTKKRSIIKKSKQISDSESDSDVSFFDSKDKRKISGNAKKSRKSFKALKKEVSDSESDFEENDLSDEKKTRKAKKKSPIKRSSVIRKGDASGSESQDDLKDKNSDSSDASEKVSEPPIKRKSEKVSEIESEVDSDDDDGNELKDAKDDKIAENEKKKQEKDSSDLDTSSLSESELVPLKDEPKTKKSIKTKKKSQSSSQSDDSKKKSSKVKKKSSQSSSDSDEETLANKKQKPVKKNEKDTKKSKPDKHTTTFNNLKRICKEAGTSFIHRIKGCNSDKEKVKRIRSYLEELGMEGYPTLKKAKKLRLQREAAELDASNIISSSQGRTRRRGEDIFSSRPKSPTPDITPVKTKFSRLKDIIDSEGSSD